MDTSNVTEHVNILTKITIYNEIISIKINCNSCGAGGSELRSSWQVATYLAASLQQSSLSPIMIGSLSESFNWEKIWDYLGYFSKIFSISDK